MADVDILDSGRRTRLGDLDEVCHPPPGVGEAFVPAIEGIPLPAGGFTDRYIRKPHRFVRSWISGPNAVTLRLVPVAQGQVIQPQAVCRVGRNQMIVLGQLRQDLQAAVRNADPDI